MPTRHIGVPLASGSQSVPSSPLSVLNTDDITPSTPIESMEPCRSAYEGADCDTDWDDSSDEEDGTSSSENGLSPHRRLSHSIRSPSLERSHTISTMGHTRSSSGRHGISDVIELQSKKVKKKTIKLVERLLRHRRIGMDHFLPLWINDRRCTRAHRVNMLREALKTPELRECLPIQEMLEILVDVVRHEWKEILKTDTFGRMDEIQSSAPLDVSTAYERLRTTSPTWLTTLCHLLSPFRGHQESYTGRKPDDAVPKRLQRKYVFFTLLGLGVASPR